MTAAAPACETELRIDLSALRANHACLAARSGPAELAPVVKADAYGLGADRIAPVLWELGARTFFVARLGEGEALRARLGPHRSSTIYVLDGCPAGAAHRLIAADLAPVLNGLDQISAYAAAASGERRALPCALHIDTGMNRLGLRPEEASALARSLGPLQKLKADLVMSHLACGSEPDHPMNARQLAALLALRGEFPNARFSLAASGGLFLDEAYRLDLTRPGICLYGGGPFETPHPEIKAVASLTAPILQIKSVRPGETIGYGRGFHATDSLRIAIIAAGYADGVLRSASPRGYAAFNGQNRRLLGRVSMDLIAVDMTDEPAAEPGLAVELFGRYLALDDFAKACGSLSYEVLTRIAPRVRRTYLEHGL